MSTRKLSVTLNRLSTAEASLRLSVEYMTAGDMGRGNLAAKDAQTQIRLAQLDIVEIIKSLRAIAGNIMGEAE